MPGPLFGRKVRAASAAARAGVERRRAENMNKQKDNQKGSKNTLQTEHFAFPAAVQAASEGGRCPKLGPAVRSPGPLASPWRRWRRNCPLNRQNKTRHMRNAQYMRNCQRAKKKDRDEKTKGKKKEKNKDKSAKIMDEDEKTKGKKKKKDEDKSAMKDEDEKIGDAGETSGLGC